MKYSYLVKKHMAMLYDGVCCNVAERVAKKRVWEKC